MRRIQGYPIRGRFNVGCRQCAGSTTLKYAREHGGLCKSCATAYDHVSPAGTPVPRPERESESSKHADAGYMNDTRFGDLPDF